MDTDALRSQVATKWQESFNRFNRGEPGISGLITFSQAWHIATDFLRPKDLEHPVSNDMDRVKAAFDMINQCRKLPVLLETFLEDVRKHHYLIRRDIDQFMLKYEATSDPQVIADLISRLLAWYRAWSPVRELGSTIRSAYTLTFQTLLFSTLPPSFARGFKALCVSTLPSDASSPSSSDAKMILNPTIWHAFEHLGLIERYESLIASVGYEHIESHILSRCAGKWDEPMLAELRDWMADKMVPWMQLAYARGATTVDEVKAMLQGVGSRFDFHMQKTLCELRTKEIFDIIVDYPDSNGALEDLKDCLQRVDQRSSLVQALRKATKKRLLHPGADTKTILEQYVQTIRCLRIIDPPGVLLFKVADPIRRYLRERPDTIRNIVASLVGDGESGESLIDDTDPIQPLKQAEVEDYSDPCWEPEPIDAGPDFRTNKPSDVISTLVSIYDSKDLFVKELQVLLAQRLLKEGDVEKERRNIEILKIRFGDAALQVCEVMLKDITDSRRIDDHVQSQKPSIVHPTIISRHFWPALDSGDILMPGQFQQLQKQYAKEFSTFKPDKKLRWLPHLGTVSVELELQDRKIEAEVPPLEAAFIELFSQKNTWSLEELGLQVGSTDRTAALKALATWVDLGVIKEDAEGSFTVLEVAEETAPGAKFSRLVTAVDEPPPVATIQQQQAEQMKVYWKFIEGMLTNLGALSLDRIQAMLKHAPGYDRTPEQLASFMEAARREGLVSGKDGMWRLNR